MIIRYLLSCFAACVFCFSFGNISWAQKKSEFLVPYRIGEFWGFSNKAGELRVPVEFEEVEPFQKDLAKVKKKGLWGTIDQKGRQVLPCEYSVVYSASTKGRVVVCKGGDKSGHQGTWGFVPLYTPQTPIPLSYDLIRECGGEGLLGVKQNGKWGAIDERGKMLIPTEYEVQRTTDHQLNSENTLPIMLPHEDNDNNPYLKLRFYNHLARVSKYQKWGFINESGVAVIPLQYEFVGNFSEGLVAVVGKTQEGIRLGFINHFHDTIVPLRYEVRDGIYQKTQFQQGLAIVGQGGKLGYINTKGQTIIPFQFAQAHNFSESRAWVSEDYHSLQPTWKMINETGQTIYTLPKDCQLLDFEFQNGFVRVRRGKEENFLSRKGELLLDNWAIHTAPFEDDMALVAIEKEGKQTMGYISTKGNWIIEPIYDFSPQGNNTQKTAHFIRLRLAGKAGVVNVKGRVFVPFEYDDVALPFYIVENQLYGVYKRLPALQNGKWGYLKRNNKWAISPQYEQARFFSEGFAKVRFEGKWGYINPKNKRFWK